MNSTQRNPCWLFDRTKNSRHFQDGSAPRLKAGKCQIRKSVLSAWDKWSKGVNDDHHLEKSPRCDGGGCNLSESRRLGVPPCSSQYGPTLRALLIHFSGGRARQQASGPQPRAERTEELFRRKQIELDGKSVSSSALEPAESLGR